MAGPSTLRRVLFICPYFSPAHISSVHRTRQLALHMPSLGWQPVVLTAPHHRYERDLDWRLHGQLPPEVEIHHVFTIPEYPFRVGDLSFRVLPGMAWRSFSLCRRGDIELVFFTGGPWFAFSLGPILKHRFKIPYVLDYQDPWNYEPKGWDPPPPLSRLGLMRRAQMWLEPHVLKHASRVVAVSPGTHEILKERYPWLDENRFSTIPIGVERSDFQLSAESRSDGRAGKTGTDTIDVVYTGAVWYGARPVFEAFLMALKKIVSGKSEFHKRLRVRFIGTGLHKDQSKNGWVAQSAKELDLGDVVHETCRSEPYLDAIAAMQEADILLLFGSPERYYMASKLFQYIKSKKPLFAVIYSQSPMRPFLNACTNTAIITYDEKEPVRQKIEEIAARFSAFVQENERCKRPNRFPDLSEYTGFAVSDRFSKVFGDVVRRPKGP